jgi:hypothetical protein
MAQGRVILFNDGGGDEIVESGEGSNPQPIPARRNIGQFWDGLEMDDPFGLDQPVFHVNE